MQDSPMDMARILLDYSPEELNRLEHAKLYQAREYLSGAEAQNKLAGPEHRAFAREATAENPLLALPIALAAVAYQPYKALAGKSRSDGSLEQALQGIIGVGEGLGEYGSEKIDQIKKMFR